ncbi:hypothetical protein A2U01_0011860, partial [Trifolium medium]|nr:hypothetical protein [Trifolium medium]
FHHSTCNLSNPEAQPLQPQHPHHGNLQNLYDSLKPLIWRLYVDEANNPNRNGTLTAFAVGPGLLMCTRKLNCDMVMVQIRGEGVEKIEVARLGSGKLEVGETIMAFGHPWQFFASGMVGHNIYPIMGHAWNADIFNWAKDDPTDMRDLSFEKNLLANCPIIQAAGMICGPGSSGSPVFNVKGEIVGMHLYGIKSFEVCVHVTALRSFLDNYLTVGGAAMHHQARGQSEVVAIEE